MTRDEALALLKTEFWKDMTAKEIALFQIFEDRLCMPFGVFHEAVEQALERPVWTHEFGLNRDGLKEELLGEQPTPSMEDIFNLIPSDKRIIVVP